MEEMLEIIDFALISVYLELQLYESLVKLFKGSKINCGSQYKVLKDAIINIKGEAAWQILPRFEESFDRVDEALASWKANSDTSNERLVKEACEEGVRILEKNQERNRIFKHLGWILKKSMPIGTRFFETMDDKLITPVSMQKFIDEMDLDNNSRRVLKEKYLEVLVL